jgi:probable 2-oxoglutarate dehydrogenase E1 component DHKTD1
LKTLFETSAEVGINEIVMGIPHRGRLNVLVNLLGYPASDLFRKISGKTDTPIDLPGAIDDVTSHIARSTPVEYETSQGKKKIYISTVHNPSHL